MATRAHCWIRVHQDTQVPLRRAALQQVHPKPVLVHGAVPPQVQDPTLALVETHQVPLCPTLQPVHITLNGSTAFWCIYHSSQFGVITLGNRALGNTAWATTGANKASGLLVRVKNGKTGGAEKKIFSLGRRSQLLCWGIASHWTPAFQRKMKFMKDLLICSEDGKTSC